MPLAFFAGVGLGEINGLVSFNLPRYQSFTDVVLLAGKGHETYQVRGQTKHPFDERLIVQQLLG